MIELAEMFIKVVPQYLDNIREAILQKNSEMLNKSAHTLKGTLKTFWVKFAHETAQSLELLGKNASLDQAMELYNLLENQVADVVQDLELMTQNLQ
jgi:HPt (histidine-containing phosphotransfer) domain-containing protein